MVLYGSRVWPVQSTAGRLTSDGRFTTDLAGTQVLFDGAPAPLLYASSGQLAAVVPYEIDGKSGTHVQVVNSGGVSDPLALPVTPAAPSIFSADYTGSGQGAILNQGGVTVNSSANPAEKGSVIAIYATGGGQTSPAGIDGQLALATLPKPKLPVQVLIGGRPAELRYAGAAPAAVAGLFQVNARIPADTPSGEIPVLVQVGNAVSQPGITVAVK